MAAVSNIVSQMQGSASSIAQAAAIEALEGDHSFLAAHRSVFRARRDSIVDRLSAIPGLSLRPPDGAFYVYVNCGALLGRTTPDGTRLKSDSDLAEALVSFAGVTSIPGAAFGLSPYLRLSYALDEKLIGEGVSRIDALVRTLA